MSAPTARAPRQSPRLDACGLCGSGRMELEFKARGIPKPDEFSVYRCRDCGLGQSWPRVPDSEIGRWYPPAYYGKNNVRFNVAFEWMVRLLRRRRARVIAKRTVPGPVLDVGCGRGFLLKNLRDLGFAPRGLELTESGAWHARHQLGIDTYVGPFESAPRPSAGFQAIIFWHSLEHMSDPVKTLSRARELLVPGGLLVVAVPNSESLQARWLRSAWFHLDVPRHYFHFGTRSLTRALKREGFRITKIDHFSFEQNPYGWLQSLYNALGLEFNYFYNFLKSRSSRFIPLKQHPLQACVILALLPLFLPLSFMLTVLEAAVRRGGTIEVYAVKQ